MFASFPAPSLSKTPTNNNLVVLDQVIEGPHLSRSNNIATELALY